MPKVSPDYLVARREHILTAAATRFARDGFHRTSMQDVVDETGLSWGAVYRYFRSKDEMIVAISVTAMGLVETVVRDALAARRPIPDLVAELPRACLDQEGAENRMRLAVQAWGEALRNPTLAEAMQQGLNGVRAALAERIGMGQRDGTVDRDVDPAAAADVLLGVVQGFILQQCWEPGRNPAAYSTAAAAVVAGALNR